MDDSTILFSLCVADVQHTAKNKLNRELTEEELYSVKKGIEWGLGETQWEVIGAAIDNLDTKGSNNEIEIERCFSGNTYKVKLSAYGNEDSGEFYLEAAPLNSDAYENLLTILEVVRAFIRPITGHEEAIYVGYYHDDQEKLQELINHATKLLEDRDWVCNTLEPIINAWATKFGRWME